MQSLITDELDLLFRWTAPHDCTIRISLASNSELEMVCHLSSKGRLSYQGTTTISFQTMCYGYDLGQFSSQLGILARSESRSAKFINTAEDFELDVLSQQVSSDLAFYSELRYRFGHNIEKMRSESELKVTVGPVEQIEQSAETILKYLTLLKVDCRNPFEIAG